MCGSAIEGIDRMGKKAILIGCFGWYDDRLKYIENYLTKAGYEVFVVISDFDHIKKEKIKGPSGKNLIYVKVPEYRKNISLKRLYSHFVFCKGTEKIIHKKRPDFVYALIPPNYLLYILKKKKKEIGYTLVADIIDLWPEGFPMGGLDFFPFKIWRNLRDKSMDAVDHLVLECEFYSKSLRNWGGQRPYSILRLIKENKIAFAENEEINLSTDKFVLGYLGSINFLIDIEAICRVVKKLLKYRPVEVEIIGCGSNEEQFISELEKNGATVHFHGKIFDEEKKYEVFRKCHFGLNIYKERLPIGLTIKSIDYFNYGLPILNSISGDTHSIVEEYNAGVNIECIDDESYLERINQYEFDRNQIFNMFCKLFSAEMVNDRLGFLDDLI